MRTALIDNSTVSSVQRALGKAKSYERDLLDVEQAALDRFVQSVLFTDRVIVPDNYKEKFTESRKTLLGKFNVNFAAVDQPIDQDLSDISNGLLGPWLEAFVQGSDRSLFSEYFSQIQAFSDFIWEHSSSEFFLVFRAHGIGKDSPLIEALLASPADDALGRQLKIIAGDGGEVPWNRMSRHVQRMLSVMGWLGHQFIWYQAFAARHDLIYSPHPLREFFANDFLTKVRLGANRIDQFSDVFSAGLKRFKTKLQSNLNDIGAHQNSYQFDLPNILPGIIKQASDPDDFITIVNQLRQENHVKELRAVLNEIAQEADVGAHRKRRQLLNDFDSIGNALIAELGVEARFLRLKPPTTVTGISVEGEDTGIKIPIPSALYRQYFLNRKYRSFLRDVMRDLAAPSQYGRLKTKIDGWAWLDENSEFAGKRFWQKSYQFPSKFHKPLSHPYE